MAKRAVLIAGPTASGKSALALARARDTGGVIVNADAMQVYDVLRVLTARPGEAELAQAPHALFGAVPPSTRFSTGAWRDAVAALLADPALAGRPLIFVGGTGLYFEALLEGFADVPAIDPEIVAAIAREVDALDASGRAGLLAARDPEMARRLSAPDPQRVIRALSVLAGTGRSLANFAGRGQGGLLDDFDVERIVLDPGREILAERIAGRFATMLEGGAVAEVEALLALGLDPALPAMKAIGVREIAAWRAGSMSREEAIERAVVATRQYAKRQRTWLRNRLGDWPRFIAPQAQ